jgi:DNA ligase-1
MTAYSDLARLCEKLENTSSRLKMRDLIADFLRGLAPKEMPVSVNLIVGRIFPESEARSLGMSFQLIFRVMAELGQPRRAYERAFAEAIDAGEAVRIMLQGVNVRSAHLSVLEVYKYMTSIGEAQGKGSKGQKEEIFKQLLSRVDATEAKYITKSMLGEMRHGVSEGIMLDSVAQAAGVSRELIRRAHMFIGDIGKLAGIALAEGEKALLNARPVLFQPVRPMLAQPARDLDEAWHLLGGTLALEYKYDGARVQIHKDGKEVRAYSRRLTDITEAFPEIVQEFVKLRVNRILLDGEVIGVGKGGRPLPFQHIMRRLTRVHAIDEAMKKIPVEFHLFDCLMIEERLLVDSPYETRWEVLSGTVSGRRLAKRSIPRSLDEAHSFFDDAVEEGHEGVVAKAMSTTYTPGARGSSWLKVKRANTVDLVILAADWGYGRRHGWLSNYHLGVLDETTGRYVLVGKTFKGLRDGEFQSLTEQLLSLQVGKRGKTVYVEPRIVLEVTYNEIQRSPRYSSGLALRFARVTRVRSDKSPLQVTTLKTLRLLYQRESAKKGRISES